LTNNLQQILIKKKTWTDEEIAQAEELLDICNAYENLSIKLGLVMLRSRKGEETNDFPYYVDGKLVGLLTLDDYGQEDREITGMVHPDYRRRGIFTALLAAARAEAKQRGIERLVLICERFSRSGQGFVEAIGAKYDFSEHRMVLGNLKERGPFQENIQLQKAALNDREKIAQVSSISFGQNIERTRQHVTEAMSDPHCQYFMGKLGAEVIGCLNLFANDREFGIYGFGVLPQYRGRGFGRQMLELLIKSVRAESSKSIALEVETDNTNAIGLYRSCGFQETTTYGYYNIDLT
jgi:ribosomal protein S18 acetylase RimI-like enzyme